MASENNFFGIETLKMAPPLDGIMGTELVEFPDIEVGSVTLEGEQATENTIPTESNDSYVTLNSDVTPFTFTVRLFGVAEADYPMLMGGSTASNKWSAPKSKPNIFLSVELITQSLNGYHRVLQVPYGKVNARLQGSVTKDGIPAIDVQVTANVPVTSGGAEGAPYTVERITE